MFLLSTVLGLPAHVLLVHAAVVLVPLAAAAFIAFGWRTSWRRRYGIALAAVAIIGSISAFLSQQTGEALQQTVRAAAQATGAGRVSFGEHPEQGTSAMIWAFFFAVAMVAVLFMDRRQSDGARRQLPAWAPAATYGIAVIPALLAILTIVAAGHSGASLVWHDLGNYVSS